jgi:hypothetical protein
MTLRRWALGCGCAVLMIRIDDSAAIGVWGMDPIIGVVGNYSSNPELAHLPDTGVTSGAFTLDAPSTYTDGRFKLSADPSVRVGDSNGYSTLTSDYYHINAKGEFDTERSTLSASAGFARDSSLTFNYATNGSGGVRRDSTVADVNWDVRPTERTDFDLDGSAQRVLFGEPVNISGFQDYEYNSASPTLGWIADERTRLTLIGGVSRYDSLGLHNMFDGPYSTESRSETVQIGFVRQLDELWTLTALGGFTRAFDRNYGTQYELAAFQGFLFYVPISVDERSSQSASVYSANLVHKGSQLFLNATASRSLAPTGLAYLNRTDVYDLQATYNLNERWALNGDVKSVEYQYPPANGSQSVVNLRYFSLGVTWHWTEQWLVTLTADRHTQTESYNTFKLASNDVMLSLSRQFGHLSYD